MTKHSKLLLLCALMIVCLTSCTPANSGDAETVTHTAPESAYGNVSNELKEDPDHSTEPMETFPDGETTKDTDHEAEENTVPNGADEPQTGKDPNQGEWDPQ